MSSTSSPTTSPANSHTFSRNEELVLLALYDKELTGSDILGFIEATCKEFSGQFNYAAFTYPYQVLKSLEKLGLIVSELNEEDNRQRFYKLTDLGIEVVCTIMRFRASLMAGKIAGKLTIHKSCKSSSQDLSSPATTPSNISPPRIL